MSYPNDSTCAVSVIIPMYNAEKYIGECLRSLLMQTLQDFEVIVVDDCSTDKSANIVERYTPRFDGRLMFASTRTNSGGNGYIPRNLGLKLASGEYVYFVDSDDFILNTALETLYNAAKENEADVVYSSAYYDMRRLNDIYLVQDVEHDNLLKQGIKDEPTVATDDADKNLQQLFVEGNYHTPWTRFVRRDFLLENEIEFPDLVTDGDFIWTVNVCSCAKKFLRLPVPLYFWRHYNDRALSNINGTPSEQIAYAVSAFIAWLKAFQELSSKTEFLRKNPAQCYLATASTFESQLSPISKAIRPLRSNEIYDILSNELSEESDTFRLTVAILFSELVRWEKNAKVSQIKVAKLKEELGQRKGKE